MIKSILGKTFDIREGELHISLSMLLYIFLIISTLLIIKPTINSLFLVELGVDQLPYAYLFVALSALITSHFYSQLVRRLELNQLIKLVLTISIVAFIIIGTLLHYKLLVGWLLYLFYIGVSVYAVLVASQFWMLANLVFNAREAKRLFSFIGSGGIAGGIFGGYLTTLLVPSLGNANLFFIAAGLLALCFPLLSYVWNTKVSKLNVFTQQKRIPNTADRPLQLIRSSKHLSYLAGIIAIGVITARLIDFQFSDIAIKQIPDSEALTSFFGFWLSTFNVISLIIQLFITRKVVGVWGVGYSLLILPVLLIVGSMLFFVFPELWVVILLKAFDGSLKQSINKSAQELLALPIPFSLKSQTKSFIDVVVDSVATGIAGCILIFFIKGLEVPDYVITILIITLAIFWVFFVWQVRNEYFLSFLNHLRRQGINSKRARKIVDKNSFLIGMKNVFANGTEKEIRYMLSKVREINDSRFTEDVRALLRHPSNAVKTEAIKNLYFLDRDTIDTEVTQLLHTADDELVLATLEYLLAHADNNESIIFDHYLDSTNEFIAGAALVCLAKEARTNEVLGEKYQLQLRIDHKIEAIKTSQEDELMELLAIIGFADYHNGYPLVLASLQHTNTKIVHAALKAAALSLNGTFLDSILLLLPNKLYRPAALTTLHQYGSGLIPILTTKILDNNTPLTISRLLPRVIAAFISQDAVKVLFMLLTQAEDLTVRLECIRELTNLKSANPSLHFNKKLIAKIILAECKLYNQTLHAMHTQVIVHFLHRKKQKIKISAEEMAARESLMELLEKRLEAGLERIFKLLELKYTQADVQIAYQGILSEEQERRIHAIEFLDTLLNPTLRFVLMPIVESSILDTSSQEVIELISKNKMSEYACFESILKQKDLKLKLAVLYLIEQKHDPKYLPLLHEQLLSNHPKIKTFAQRAQAVLLT